MFNYLSYFLSALFVVFITILTWFIINVKNIEINSGELELWNEKLYML